jgi:hypothetical protein
MAAFRHAPYAYDVDERRRNFADPDYEPTDADLMELSAEAFAGVGKAHEAALVKMYAEIEVARKAALADLKNMDR